MGNAFKLEKYGFQLKVTSRFLSTIQTDSGRLSNGLSQIGSGNFFAELS
jgi:hypothetical protein